MGAARHWTSWIAIRSLRPLNATSRAWRGSGCARRGGGRCAGEDDPGVGVRSDSRGFVHPETGEVVPAHERIGFMDPDPDLRYKVGDIALFGETLLDRDGTVDGVSRVREGREEPIAAATLSHLHALMLRRGVRGSSDRGHA